MSLEDIISYIKVAPFPHTFSTLFGGVSILSYGSFIGEITSGDYLSAAVYSTTSLLSFGIGVFAEFDAKSRFSEYKRVKSLLDRYGWNEKVIKPLLYSRCQRDAGRLAASQLGYGDEVKEFYKDKGYSWYHIIPDYLIENPKYFFDKDFWKASFFQKTR